MNRYAIVMVSVIMLASSVSFGKGGSGSGNGGGSGKGDAIQQAQQERERLKAEKKIMSNEKKQEREQKMEQTREKREQAKQERSQKSAGNTEASTGTAEGSKEKRQEQMKERKQTRESGQTGDSGKTAEGQQKKSGETKGQDVVDNRQERQDKRIQHGINKGYLTDDEVAKLNSQQSKIETLESSLTGDGSMSKQDFKQLQTELNTASHCIWGEKHDTDGNQMAAYRFGKNVFAKSDLTAKMTDENLSKGEAKKICKDFRSMMDAKKQLSGSLSDSEREKLQAQYDELLNQYFETR